LSKIFNPAWMEKMGFSSEDSQSDRTISDLIKYKNLKKVELKYAQPEETISSALMTMEKNGLSHLPVAIGEIPLAAAEVIGSVSKEILTDQSDKGDELTIKDFLESPLELVGVGENLFPRIVTLFEEIETALVLDGGKPITTLSKSDIDKFLKDPDNEVNGE